MRKTSCFFPQRIFAFCVCGLEISSANRASPTFYSMPSRHLFAKESMNHFKLNATITHHNSYHLWSFYLALKININITINRYISRLINVNKYIFSLMPSFAAFPSSVMCKQSLKSSARYWSACTVSRTLPSWCPTSTLATRTCCPSIMTRISGVR